MKIYIEVLIIVALIIIFLLWMIWNSFSLRRLKKKYKPENDKSNKGGEQNAEIEGTEQRVGTDGAEQRTDGAEQRVERKGRDTIGLGESERREDLPKIPTSDVRKTSSSNRKNGRGIRKLLKRRRRT